MFGSPTMNSTNVTTFLGSTTTTNATDSYGGGMSTFALISFIVL